MDNGRSTENRSVGPEELSRINAVLQANAANEWASSIAAQSFQEFASPLDTTERKKRLTRSAKLGDPTPTHIVFTACLEESGDPIRINSAGDVKLRLQAFSDQMPQILQLLALVDQSFTVTVTPD